MPPPLPSPDGRISGEHPPAPPPPKANTKILSIFLIGVIMISITSLFFVLLGLASVILLPLLLSSIHRHHRRRRRHRRHESSNGFSSRRVKKLPQFKFSEPTRYGSDCVVCLEGFRQGQWCRRLVGCGHVFHRRCVDTWLVKAAACPICRAKVRLDEKDEKGGTFWECFGQRRSSLLDL